jgi:hypothetical protein
MEKYFEVARAMVFAQLVRATKQSVAGLTRPERAMEAFQQGKTGPCGGTPEEEAVLGVFFAVGTDWRGQIAQRFEAQAGKQAVVEILA